MEKKERDFKSTFEQWKVVVEYFEENPNLLKSKFSNFDGDKTISRGLWEQLVLRLNSMGHGVRSVEKWQLAIGRWKSKVKAKASALRIEMQRTGGGQVKTPPLNPVEQRLMALLGWKSVSGDQNLELGLWSPSSASRYKSPESSLLVTRAEDPQLSISKEDPQPSTSREDPHPSISHCHGHFETDLPPPLTPLTPKRKKIEVQGPRTPQKKKVIKSTEKSRRFVSLNRMHEQTLQRLTNIDTNVSKMANSLQTIAGGINRYVDFMTKLEES